MERHELMRLVDRQVLDEDPVDDAEDRRVGADAQRARRDGRRRESLMVPQCSSGIPKVPTKLVDCAQAETLASKFPELFHRSELEPRAPHGRGWGQSLACGEIVGPGAKVE